MTEANKMKRYQAIVIAVAAVVLVAVVSTAVVNSRSEGRSQEISLISGLEGVGTGFYYDSDSISKGDLFVLNDDGSLKTRTNSEGYEVAIFKPAGWERLTFGIPTVGSIQYYQLKTIVEVYLNDASYTDGTTLSLKLVSTSPGSGQVGYLVTGGSVSSIKEYVSQGLKIGVTWDPQYSALTTGDNAPFDGLITTAELFPHVTCCVLYANASFIEENRETSERLVWAIVNATNWLNAVYDDIKENGYDSSKESHKALVSFALKYAGGSNSGLTEEQILNSFDSIEYGWGDEITGKYDASNPLTKVKSDIAEQTDTLYSVGVLIKSLEDLGFKDSTEFAESFVDDSVLSAALKVSSWSGDAKAKVTFSTIANDVHQLPVHLANEVLPGLSEILGNDQLKDGITLFEQAGIEISLLSASGSSQVITQMQSNEADFGVAAQPGVIAYDINNALTKR